jgi:hypothetical protein
LGTEPGQFGAADNAEAESEAPRSLAVEAAGRHVYVLDQLNQRVDVYAGSSMERTIAIPTRTANELAVLGGERVVIMDRYQDRFTLLDAKGQSAGSSPISGDGLSGPEYAGRIYARADGVWMEAGPLFVRVLNAEGAAVQARRMLPGLPSPNGEWLLTLELLGDGTLHVVLRPTRGLGGYRQTQLAFDNRVAHVSGYDLDDSGRVYIGTEHVWEESGALRSQPLLSVLSSELELLRQHELPLDETGRSVSHSLAVTPSGAAFRLQVEPERVSVLRY